MAYSPTHPGANSLKKPLIWSLEFHLLLFGSLAASTYFSHRGDSWGGPGGGGAVSVGLVAKVPAIPLPQPDAVTESRVVDSSKGLYKSEPPPKPQPEPDAQPIPKFKQEQQPHYITPPSKILEDKTPPPPNAIPYGGGGSPAIPYSSSQQQPAQVQPQAQQQQFSVSGATQGGMAFSGPGGGDFSGRFPSYVEGVRNRVSSNWLQSSVDPGVPWAPRATYTFQILRDGTVTNIQLMQSSGNRSVDNSALRAILSSSPVSPLPSGYSGNNVTVEFWFEFHR